MQKCGDFLKSPTLVKDYPKYKPLIESIIFRDENHKVVPIDEYFS